jgi:GntR family transcriptional regulator, arabinose operon transcriptional repressor
MAWSNSEVPRRIIAEQAKSRQNTRSLSFHPLSNMHSVNLVELVGYGDYCKVSIAEYGNLVSFGELQPLKIGKNSNKMGCTRRASNYLLPRWEAALMSPPSLVQQLVFKEPDSMNEPQSRVRQLAAELEEDIRGRELVCGDRYLTTAEASRMLGARRSTVNQAMQLLVDREMLVRRRRIGAVVGPKMGRRRTERIRLVKVVMPVERIEISGPLDDWVHGVHRSMPGTDVQFCFIPADDAVSYIQAVVMNAERTRATVGFILASCPRDIHRVVKEGGFPAVVAGSVYSDVGDLPSVDLDNFQLGRVVAEYVVGRGHRRIGYLAFEHWRPGDNSLLEGLNARLGEAELGSDALRVRCLPSDAEIIEAEAKRVLLHANPPTALICRTCIYAAAAWEAAQQLELRVPDDLLILSCDGDPTKRTKARLPFIQSAVGHRRVVELAGELLLAQFNKQKIEQPQICIDVELVDRQR